MESEVMTALRGGEAAIQALMQRIAARNPDHQDRFDAYFDVANETVGHPDWGHAFTHRRALAGMLESAAALTGTVLREAEGMCQLHINAYAQSRWGQDWDEDVLRVQQQFKSICATSGFADPAPPDPDHRRPACDAPAP